ncbi:MAG: class I tRNA ligase family protein, partial [Hyphomicrobiales bacterium]
RWLNRIWSLVLEPVQFTDAPESPEARDLRRLTHKTIRDAMKDIEEFAFNTLISKQMELASGLQKRRDAGPVDRTAWNEAIETMLLLAAPLAPHITEELWSRLGKPYSIHQQRWPRFDPDLARDEEVEIVLQVNGKVRDRLTLPAGATEEQARAAAFASPRMAELLGGKEPRRVIYVPGRLLNVVV